MRVSGLWQRNRHFDARCTSCHAQRTSSRRSLSESAPTVNAPPHPAWPARPHARTHARTHVYMSIRLHVPLHACTLASRRACKQARTHACTHAYVHTRMHVCTRAYVHTRTHVCTRAYMHAMQSHCGTHTPACLHPRKHMRACTHTCACTCTRVYMCPYMSACKACAHHSHRHTLIDTQACACLYTCLYTGLLLGFGGMSIHMSIHRAATRLRRPDCTQPWCPAAPAWHSAEVRCAGAIA